MVSICFVVRGYPTKDNSSYAFLQPVIRGIADKGIECTVIAPWPVNGHNKSGAKRPYVWQDETDNGKKITIYQPRYIALPGTMINGININIWRRESAVNKVLKSIQKPDVIYGHFWDCVLMSADFCTKNAIPLIAVIGESDIEAERYFSRQRIEKKLTALRGFISVSSKNIRECKRLGLIPNNCPILLAPNAIDTRLFFKEEKKKAKSAIGLSEDDFVISFVGSYGERKGVNRLIEAAKVVPQSKLILIGYGDALMESDQIYLAKRVPHEEVVHYLNASDIYCLPTLSEGCCNSIVEAMACGLPVISSNLEFNDDILNSQNSIRIDTSSVSEISGAIEKMYMNAELRSNLANEAYKTAEELTIEVRVDKIIHFIKNVL